ncbi:hypothetical protein [Tychonema sp. LEGE 07203]|nr:hypothetical protein [Tychonema sp. LEGE 07203]MBE9092895.1 hypothetical protein [Tychonema sp. LEGE 07203]
MRNLVFGRCCGLLQSTSVKKTVSDGPCVYDYSSELRSPQIKLKGDRT